MSRVVSCMNSLVISRFLGRLLACSTNYSLLLTFFLFFFLFMFTDRITFSLTLSCVAVAFFLFGGENKTFYLFHHVFKAWAGGIGVQIFVFCLFKGELKKCSFFLLYIYVLYIFARLG